MFNEPNNGVALKKTRFDVILSAAIEEDFILALDRYRPGIHYTKMTSVVGRGYSVPKLGDPVWPQFNSAFVMFCDGDESDIVLRVVDELRQKYLGEGLACWKSSAVEC
jgi:hypothetical protein